MSKDDETPAAASAAGPSLIPHTDCAVREAYNLYADWLRQMLGDDLNGKQIAAAAATALQITVPRVRIAAIRDLADAVEAASGLPLLLSEGLRDVADRVATQDAEVPRAGS